MCTFSKRRARGRESSEFSDLRSARLGFDCEAEPLCRNRLRIHSGLRRVRAEERVSSEQSGGAVYRRPAAVISTDIVLSRNGTTMFVASMLNAATGSRKPQVTTANDA
jgi:hypothetical protein